MSNELETHITTINKNLRELKKRFFVKKIAIFGSIARGNSTQKSDIDIIVEFNRSIGFFTFIELENHLEKILGKKVDLVTKNSLKASIKKSVLKEAIYV